MAKQIIQKQRGTQDILPADQAWWGLLRGSFERITQAAGYGRISTPMFEATELFARGVGESTEIVSKEMYSFEDKSGNSITLKPESTAGVVRAYIENGMASLPKPVRLYYIEPAFRYERPQAGRYRQHHQASVEVFGSAEARLDAEVIALAARFYRALGVPYRLVLNSVGDSVDRDAFKTALREYFGQFSDQLTDIAKLQLEKNPLRILDSKDPDISKLCDNAPKLGDYLGEEAKVHFAQLQKYLDELGISYEFDTRLVRGLDYYNRTVFEFKGTHEGMQDSIGGGGRYDGLVEQLGGQPTPAVGFSLGMERIIQELTQSESEAPQREVDVYIAGLSREAQDKLFIITQQLLDDGLSVANSNSVKDSVGAQLAQAASLKARYAVLVGDEELKSGQAMVKELASTDQQQVAFDDLRAYLTK